MVIGQALITNYRLLITETRIRQFTTTIMPAPRVGGIEVAAELGAAGVKEELEGATVAAPCPGAADHAAAGGAADGAVAVGVAAFNVGTVLGDAELAASAGAAACLPFTGPANKAAGIG